MDLTLPQDESSEKTPTTSSTESLLGRKRVRLNPNEDVFQETDSDDEDIMATNASVPQQAKNIEAEPTIRFNSANSSSNASPISDPLIFEAIVTALKNFIESKVKEYGAIRFEMYKRSASIRNLQRHQANSTFPKDLCWKTESGNPYKKTVTNRDQLLANEQVMILDVKKQILNTRLAVAKEDLEKISATCLPFFDVRTVMTSFVEEFPDKSLLKKVNTEDCINLYNYQLQRKRTHMDEYCKKREEQYAHAMSQKQKKTPLTQTVNERQFREALDDHIYKRIVDFGNKYAPKTKGKQTKAAEEATTVRPIKKRPPVSNVQPDIKVKTSRQSRKKKQSTNQFTNRTTNQQTDVPKTQTSGGPAKVQSTTKRSFASVVASTQPTAPVPSPLPKNAVMKPKTVIIDGEEYTLVTRKNNRNQKNGSAEDSRKVPKKSQKQSKRT